MPRFAHMVNYFKSPEGLSHAQVAAFERHVKTINQYMEDDMFSDEKFIRIPINDPGTDRLVLFELKRLVEMAGSELYIGENDGEWILGLVCR